MVKMLVVVLVLGLLLVGGVGLIYDGDGDEKNNLEDIRIETQRILDSSVFLGSPAEQRAKAEEWARHNLANEMASITQQEQEQLVKIKETENQVGGGLDGES